MSTILVIEDDTIVRANTAEILELAGYRVLTAENGRSGVEQAKQELPDLVVCDIMMPEIDGYGVLHIVGRDPRTAHIPFIFLTARAEARDVRKGMDLGADDYLTKPFDDSVLLSAIDGRLRRQERYRANLAVGVEEFDRLMDEARGVEALKGLGRDRVIKQVRKRDMLFREGDVLRQLPMILSGTVRTYRINSEGKMIVTSLCGAGDLVGYMSLFLGSHALESAEALSDGEVSMVPREDLLALLHRDRDVSMRFIKLLAKDVAEKEVHMMQLAYASVRQRVAQMLLRARLHYAKGSDPALRISREEMASMAGTAHETVTRCLADLREEKLIATSGKEVAVLDLAGLEQVART